MEHIGYCFQDTNELAKAMHPPVAMNAGGNTHSPTCLTDDDGGDMHRLLIFLVGCAFGYVFGGYIDGYTGDDLPEIPDETGLSPQPKEAAWQ